MAEIKKKVIPVVKGVAVPALKKKIKTFNPKYKVMGANITSTVTRG